MRINMGRRIFFIEGNIGSGKSTLIANMRERLGSTGVTFIPEPVQEWVSFRDEKSGADIIELYYSDPEKYAMLFQNIIVQSKVKILLDLLVSDAAEASVYIMERSFFSDYNVFVKMMRNASQLERNVFQKWQDMCSAALSKAGYEIHFFYVDADIDACLERVERRARHGEASIDFEYLQTVDIKYKEWLATIAAVTYVDGNADPETLLEATLAVLKPNMPV